MTKSKKSPVDCTWRLVDASSQRLGRLATEVARLLMGKHKPVYSFHEDHGDPVVLINAAEICVTGNKAANKIYYWHTGFPGGIKSTSFNQLHDKDPVRVLKKAIRRMLPKNRLGEQMFRKLHVYGSAEHPHTAQQPVPFPLKTRKEC